MQIYYGLKVLKKFYPITSTTCPYYYIYWFLDSAGLSMVLSPALWIAIHKSWIHHYYIVPHLWTSKSSLLIEVFKENGGKGNKVGSFMNFSLNNITFMSFRNQISVYVFLISSRASYLSWILGLTSTFLN